MINLGRASSGLTRGPGVVRTSRQDHRGSLHLSSYSANMTSASALCLALGLVLGKRA